MIKKLILATVCLAALGAVYAIDPGGHVSTLTGYVSKWFKPSLSYQIDRAEKLIAKLGPAIKDDQEQLAREKVALGIARRRLCGRNCHQGRQQQRRK